MSLPLEGKTFFILARLNYVCFNFCPWIPALLSPSLWRDWLHSLSDQNIDTRGAVHSVQSCLCSRLNKPSFISLSLQGSSHQKSWWFLCWICSSLFLCLLRGAGRSIFQISPNEDQVERGNPCPQFTYLLLFTDPRRLMALFVTMGLSTQVSFDVCEAFMACSTYFLYSQSIFTPSCCKVSSFPCAKLCIMSC